VPVVRLDIGKDVHADGVFKIAWVEIREMVSPLRWNVVQQFFGQVTVRINHANAMPERNVLDDQISQKGSLAGAGLSNDIYMLSLILNGNAKTLGITPAFALSNDDAWVVFHDSKTSRHFCNPEIPCQLTSAVTREAAPAGCVGARWRGNGGWF
jgi:hypothetical protein